MKGLMAKCYSSTEDALVVTPKQTRRRSNGSNITLEEETKHTAVMSP